MKAILVLSLLCVSAFANDQLDVDWSRVKPITEYPEFWNGMEVQMAAKAPERGNERIFQMFVVGGTEATPHQFPFHAGLISDMPYGEALCSGSIVSQWSILTSAGCIQGARSTLVILGAIDISNRAEPLQARVRATNFRIHPGFLRNGRTITNDVGLVRLSHRIAHFHAAVSPVQLPIQFDIDQPFFNMNVITMG